MPQKQNENGPQTERDGGTPPAGEVGLRGARGYRRAISRPVMEERSSELNGRNWIRRIGNG